MPGLRCGIFILIMAGSGFAYFEELNSKVQLRLFTPDNYAKLDPSQKEVRDAVWNVGEDLDCTVHDSGEVEVYPPRGYDRNLPVKLVSGGFLISTREVAQNIVNAWMEKTNRRTNIIMIEWEELSHFSTHRLATARSFISDIFLPDKYIFRKDVYLDASQNAIHVGQYVGLVLAMLDRQSSNGINIHVVGHSLGAHCVGVVGRTFEKAAGKKLARVTGLDPAGPSFIDGPLIEAVPELMKARLNRKDAEFVDIIHSQGSLSPAVLHYNAKFGDLNPLGHADFYPDGGSTQENCEILLPLSKVGCSHERAFHYLINSIQEPNLFPSYECFNVDDCLKARSFFKGEESSNFRIPPDSYMGEIAIDYKTRSSKLYFLKLDKTEHWNYYTHGKIESVLKWRLLKTAELVKYALDGGGIFPKLGILPEITDIPKKIVQKVVDFTNALPYNWDVTDITALYCERNPDSRLCAARKLYCETFPLVPSCIIKDIDICGPSCLHDRYCERFPFALSCRLLG